MPCRRGVSRGLGIYQLGLTPLGCLILRIEPCMYRATMASPWSAWSYLLVGTSRPVHVSMSYSDHDSDYRARVRYRTKFNLILLLSSKKLYFR
eukprot:SAG31_NODE_367_length_16811_cov_20.811584_9_plen_93_part_00